MLALLSSRQSGVTFDLGAAGIRALQLRQRSAAPQQCDALQIDRPPTDDAESPPAPTVAPAQLARMIGQGRFRGRDVTLVLSTPEVQFYPLHLPDAALAQPTERIEQALKWEVSQESRAATEDLEIRFWRLPTGRGATANVMAVALRSSLALQWSLALAAEGLHLRRIDVSPCALTRLGLRRCAVTDSDLWGVLDLGLRHSTLTLVVGSVPTYIRPLGTSTHQWTQQLARAFEVPYAVAEQLKREHRIELTSDGVRATPAGANLLDATNLASALSRALRDPLQALGREVGRCFSYLMQSFPEHTVQHLFLAGGGACLRGLASVLQAELGIPVGPLGAAEADDTLPWAQPLLDVKLEPRSAAAAGAALLDLEAS
jgi:Tfp pilus assembly PilM family ATPase